MMVFLCCQYLFIYYLFVLENEYQVLEYNKIRYYNKSIESSESSHQPFTAWLIAFRTNNSGAKNKLKAGLFVLIIPPDCGTGFPSNTCTQEVAK